jgi:hypothetical protein
MAVRNQDGYLGAAIDSILGQTFTDFELVIVDSSDEESPVLRSYDDRRIRVLRQEPRGQVLAREAGLKLCRGEYLAMMDGDDLSMPERLEKQASFLDDHLGHFLVASRYVVIDLQGRVVARPPNLTEDDQIKLVLPTINILAYGSVMLRRAAIEKLGALPRRYAENNYDVAEDYDLWLQLREQGSMASLDEALYRWRRDSGGSWKYSDALRHAATKMSVEAVHAEIRAPGVRIAKRIKAMSPVPAPARPVVAMACRAYAYDLLLAGHRGEGLRCLAASVGMAPMQVRRSARRLLVMVAAIAAPKMLERIPPREYP